MSEEITASYILTSESFAPGVKWHHRLPAVQKVLIGLALLVSGMTLYWSWFSSSSEVVFTPIMAIAPLPVVVFAALNVWSRRSMEMAAIQKSPLYGRPVTFVVGADSLKLASGENSSAQSWDWYAGSLATPQGVLLYPHSGAFRWIPQAAFATESDYTCLLGWVAAKTRHSKIG